MGILSELTASLAVHFFAVFLPLAPLTAQAPRIASTTFWTPSPLRTLVNSVGPDSRMMAESRRITSREAPTWGARSVCVRQHGWKGGAYLVDDEQIGLGDAGPTLARDLVAPRNINLTGQLRRDRVNIQRR